MEPSYIITLDTNHQRRISEMERQCTDEAKESQKYREADETPKGSSSTSHSVLCLCLEYREADETPKGSTSHSVLYLCL